MPLDAQTELNEGELLSRYAAGDRAAARILTQRLTPVVYAQAWRLLRDRAEAEDVTQEALLRLWKIAPEWDVTRAKVTTWLFRVTANLCTDRLRRRGRVQPGLDGVPEQSDPAPGADARLHLQARHTAIRTAIADLPERQRDAILLRHIEGYDNPDIAARLDISVEAVESLLARGKRALKKALAGQAEALGYDNGE